MERNKYLERRVKIGGEKLGVDLEEKHRKNFERQCMYLGNGIYHWGNTHSTDTREVFLLGVLDREGIKYTGKGD